VSASGTWEICGYCLTPVRPLVSEEGISWLGEAAWIWIDGEQWKCVHAVWDLKSGIDDGVCMDAIQNSVDDECLRCHHPVGLHTRYAITRKAPENPVPIGIVVDQFLQQALNNPVKKGK
jgi:hypothetical protein